MIKGKEYSTSDISAHYNVANARDLIYKLRRDHGFTIKLVRRDFVKKYVLVGAHKGENYRTQP